MECKALTLWHRNVVLNFTPAQFNIFKDFTERLDVQDCLFPFPDGEERLILRTPNTDISFAFTTDEWNNFHLSMGEAAYMQSIYKIIY